MLQVDEVALQVDEVALQVDEVALQVDGVALQVVQNDFPACYRVLHRHS